MSLPIFIQELPAVEVREGLVHFKMDRDYVATVSLYRSFLEREVRRMADWDHENRCGRVLPFGRKD